MFSFLSFSLFFFNSPQQQPCLMVPVGFPPGACRWTTVRICAKDDRFCEFSSRKRADERFIYFYFQLLFYFLSLSLSLFALFTFPPTFRRRYQLINAIPMTGTVCGNVVPGGCVRHTARNMHMQYPDPLVPSLLLLLRFTPVPRGKISCT